MFKSILTVSTLLSLMLSTPIAFANTTIVSAPSCAMKNLDVPCENGDEIKLDVVRSHDKRGDIYINIATAEAIGKFLSISINDGQPQILRVEKLSNNQTGAFLPRSVVMKLRNASSLNFKIFMDKRSPISGSLNQDHFEWLKRFGRSCG